MIKKIVRIVSNLLNPQTEKKSIRSYLKNGKIPWPSFYSNYKYKIKKEKINSTEMLKNFNKRGLPLGFGIGLNERVV